MAALKKSVNKLLWLGRQQKHLKESQIFDELGSDVDIDTYEAVCSALAQAKIYIVMDDSDDNNTKIAPEMEWDGGAKDSVAMFLKEIGQYDLLTAEEERELLTKVVIAREAKQQIDELGRSIDDTSLRELEKIVRSGKRARDRLTEANLRLVVSVAKHYRDRGLPFLDLIQDGSLGLMRAIDKFDLSKNVRLSTYATWWIRQSILRSLANSSRLVRVPAHLDADISNISRECNAMLLETGKEPTDEELSEATQIPVKKIKNLRSWGGKPVSLDAPASEDSDNVIGDLIEDESTVNPEASSENLDLRENLLMVMARVLTKSEQDVINYRFGLDGHGHRTLKEVGDSLHVTRERIRQIEANALRKLHNTGLRRYYVNYLEEYSDSDSA